MKANGYPWRVFGVLLLCAVSGVAASFPFVFSLYADLLAKSPVPLPVLILLGLLQNRPQLFPGLVFISVGSPASLVLRRRGTTMKRTVLGIVLLGLMSAGSLMAEDHDWKRDRDFRHDYADRRADYRDMNRDRAAIDHDRWELRRDYREGNYAAAQRERAEINSRYRDLNRDERDVRRDNRDIRGDRYWDRR